ncbi:MAG: HEAT repeat domain-containing protein [Desulfobacterales bacterium]|nr:HEAT repeat domain-containing protein [Desulfobacterales bacterium]
MSQAIKNRIIFSLAVFCFCFLILFPIAENAWPQDESRIELLTRDLKDEDPNVRVKAAHALLKMGPDAEEAIPTLIEALEDEDEYVRWYAAETLERLNTPEAVEALKDYKSKSN